MSRLALYLLGSPRIELDDKEIHLSRRKALALLAYLAVTGERHRRDSLATLLWPEYDQSGARADLRRTLSLLNRALGEGWLDVDRETAGLRQAQPESSGQVLWLDVAAFRGRLAEREAHGHAAAEVCAECVPPLEEAVGLYRDDFLAGFTLRDSLAFDEWQFFQTQGLRDDLTVALERLVRWHGDQSEHEPAIAYARRWLESDPTHEPAHRRLMALYAQADQRGVALRQYDVCCRTLREELGVEPAPETTALYERIRAGEEIGREREVAVPVPHNLPPQPTPFIGREAELADLERLIGDPAVRLITIVGLGGMGKTRLALACAERQLHPSTQLEGVPIHPFRDGVHFVPLGPLSHVDQIVPTLARALNVQLQGGALDPRTPKGQVLDYLREKRLLLILDNLEHLLTPPAQQASPPMGGIEGGAADLVTDILQTAPEVKLLVTSRERLLLHEEQVYSIQGLEFPDWETPEDAAHPSDETQYSAAQLFLQSARRVQPGLTLAADDPTYLTRICRLLEGLPLGIELAAGWVDVLLLADIAAEIQRGLDFLETEWRDVRARHHSMRAVFDTSWRCLSEAEQEAVTQLCVFRGGFTRGAAREVAGADLRTLARLADRSLLQFNRARERYEMHELLRQYGAEKLATDPQAEAAVRHRHSAYYCAAMQAWEADMEGSRAQETLDRVDADIDNVRAAWEWAALQGQVSQLDQAKDGLCWFYFQRYRLLEGIAACQLAVDVLAQADPAATVSGDSGRVLAWALASQGYFYAWLGNKELAEPLLRRSSDLLDSPALSDCDTRRERAFLLWAMGCAAMPDWEQTRQAWERSVSLYRALGDQWWAANILRSLGVANVEGWGDLETARQKHEESLASFQSLGYHRGTISNLTHLGQVARETCDYDEAQRLFEEGLTLSRAQGELWGEAQSLSGIGCLALFQGQFETGRDALERAIEIRQQVGDHGGMASDLVAAGSAHWLRGRYAEADSLIEQGMAIFEAVEEWPGVMIALGNQGEVRVWAGRYQEARALARKALTLVERDPWWLPTARIHRMLGWVALAKETYVEAQGWLTESVAGHRKVEVQFAQEWLAVTLPAAARAEIGLGHRTEAQAYLVEALEIVLGIRAYIPLLFLMPIVPLALADAGGSRQVERAVELYALAESHPFVANSQLFEDIAGKQVATAAATLPPDVVVAAQARGRALDWWDTAAELLEELRLLGWQGSLS